MDKKKLLIIDDEHVILQTLKDRLEFEGFDVIAVDKGIEGINTAKSENPDLIVLDIMLQDMNGYDVCSAIKADSNIPIIMATSKIDVVDSRRARSAGADAFSVKTTDYSVLLKKIREVLELSE